MPSSHPRPLESSSEAISFIDFGDKFPLHRIDASHIPPVEEPANVASTAAPVSLFSTQNEQFLDEPKEFDPAAIRAAHADDLILHLQRWSEELDQRSARLHADMATHERRERAFRMWMQNRRAELETQIQECRQAQTKAEAAARRLAMSAG